MTLLDMGVTGAKRQSWRSDNPRPILERFLRDHPKATLEEAQEFMASWFERVSSKEARLVLYEYWTANTHRAIERERRPVKRQQAAQRAAQVTATKDAIVSTVTKIVLLELVLPNGKRLADATGKECARLGGWFAKIAERVKPNETVSSVLSETDLKKLYRAG